MSACSNAPFLYYPCCYFVNIKSGIYISRLFIFSLDCIVIHKKLFSAKIFTSFMIIILHLIFCGLFCLKVLVKPQQEIQYLSLICRLSSEYCYYNIAFPNSMDVCVFFFFLTSFDWILGTWKVRWILLR